MDITGLPKFTIRGEIRPAGDSFLPGSPSTSADDVRNFINSNPDAKTLVFEISSFGGLLNQGFEMRDLIETCGKNTIAIGYTVCSAAVLPFLACKKRLVTENVSFVIHPARIPPENLGTNPLTAADFEELSQAVRVDDKKIMDAYCATIGEDKRSKVLAYFGSETDLGAKKAIQLGFANGYWKKKAAEPVSNAVVFCVDEFTEERFSNLEISNYLSNKIMDATALKAVNDKMSFIEKALNKVLRKIGVVKNDAILSDSSGIQVGTVVSPDDNLQGKPAVEYDADGMPTQEPLDDGSYIDDKGRTVVIKGGVVESVANSAVPADAAKENEALKKKIADLEAAAALANTEKETLTNKVKELEVTNKTVAESVNSIKKEFDEFKKLVPGEKKKKEADDDGEMTQDRWKTMSNLERMQYNRIENKKMFKTA